MAGGVFRRFLEIVLDKESAKKTERDTQASLDRATDPKGASLNMDRVGRAVSSATRLFIQAGAAVAGYALALTRMTERGGQVLNVQRAFTRAVGDADAALAKLRSATAGLISDYDLMVGFNKALSLGAVKTVAEFGEMASVARELGRALGVDAAYAMEQLSLGIARHSVKILDNIGITAKATDSFATIMEKARERVEQFGGSASNTADMLQRVQVQFTNVKDQIGKFLAQSTTLRTAFFEAGNVLETLVLAMQSGELETVKDAFKHVGTILGATFAAAFFEGMAAALKKVGEDSPVLLPLLAAFAGFAVGGPIGGIVGGVSAIGALGPLPGLLDKAAIAAREAAEAEVIALGALRGQVEAAIALRGVREGTTGAAPFGVPQSSVLSEGIPRRAMQMGLQRHARFGKQVPPTTSPDVGFDVDLRSISEMQAAEFQRVVDIYRTGFTDIESAGQTAALGIEDAFSRTFSMLGEEGVTAGDILQTVFRGVASSALTAIAQYATGKITENIANAFEQFAAASAAAASANPVGAALHTKAAHGYILSAAKWAVAGGAASAAAATAGGGGASSFRGSDVTGREIDKLDRGGSVVNVYVDGFDPMNPRHQRAAYEGVARAAQRAGPNARVNIMPRGAG